MKIIRSVKKMQNISRHLKRKKSIAIVPTMGCLHEGHLSLIKAAGKKADIVIVTLFVNPTQFGKNEDFSKYPRQEKTDLRKLKNLKVDYAFLPDAGEMYPEGFKTTVCVQNVSKILCGKSRPGHFDGVATVVLKLFNITEPDYAVFGRKDYQQLILIKEMVKDLNLPVKILSHAIIRENDGLAMSSRNASLSPAERKMAISLSLGLKKVKRACFKNSLSVNKMRKVFLSQIPKNKKIRVDYIECKQADNLSDIKKYKKGKTLVATAVYVGKTRLIDNIII